MPVILSEHLKKHVHGFDTIKIRQIDKLKRFVASRGFGEAFVEFVKSLAPKTMKQKLDKPKVDGRTGGSDRTVKGTRSNALGAYNE